MILIDCGCLPLLVKLLHSKIVEVQCNACGCITTLANTGESSPPLWLSALDSQVTTQ